MTQIQVEMNIHEYQGKSILKRFGVAIQEGIVAETPEQAVEAAKQLAFTLDITSKLGDSVKLPVTSLPLMVEPDWNDEPYGDDLTPEHEPFEADIMDAAGKPI